VHISVTDNGKGIPQENLARIFDPFFTTKPVAKARAGTGHHTPDIQQHGGEIRVDSCPGKERVSHQVTHYFSTTRQRQC